MCLTFAGRFELAGRCATLDLLGTPRLKEKVPRHRTSQSGSHSIGIVHLGCENNARVNKGAIAVGQFVDGSRFGLSRI